MSQLQAYYEALAYKRLFDRFSAAGAAGNIKALHHASLYWTLYQHAVRIASI